MKEILKEKQKGITLIALVITIIVLLILAGVSIAMLTGENGILTQAQNAKTETEKAEALEKIKLEVLGSYDTNGDISTALLTENLGNIEGLTYNGEAVSEENPIEELPAIVTLNGYSYKIESNGNTEKVVIADRTGLNVGDYINYEPTLSTEETPIAYSKDKLTSAITGSSNNTVDITQDTLNWRILKIYNDGSMDVIGSSTEQYIYLNGAIGYNNGVYLLHDICEKIYSKESKGIIARSVSLEDFEDETNGGDWKSKRDSFKPAGGAPYGQTNTEYYGNSYTGIENYYPNLYENENGSGINTTTVKKDGIKDIDKYILDTSSEADAYKRAEENGLTATHTQYYISTSYFGNTKNVLTNNNRYWIASRYVFCFSSNADFGLRYVTADNYINGGRIFNSYKHTNYEWYAKLRPVVHLSSEVQIKPCEGTNSTDNTHTITQY